MLLVKRGRGETELVLLKGIPYTHVLTQKDTKNEASPAFWSLIFLWESVAHEHKKVSPLLFLLHCPAGSKKHCCVCMSGVRKEGEIKSRRI